MRDEVFERLRFCFVGVTGRSTSLTCLEGC